MNKISSISGFPEFLPSEQIAFNRAIEIIRKNYEKTGAVPIETPAVERTSTLLAKGGNDKEIYGLHRLKSNEENSRKELALHFDLTVPFARYIALHQRELIFPFRRYQIQPVWRGERAQAGRFRQFYQCDIDVVGNESLSILHDAEMPYIIYQIFRELNIGKFLIRINNRKIIKGFLLEFELGEKEINKIINIVDSIEKIGRSKVQEQLIDTGIKASDAKNILTFFNYKGSNLEVLTYLKSKVLNITYNEGVNELDQVTQAMTNLGIPNDFFTIDLSIARGLDYYTGTIYETTLLDYPSIGSICSGGRYDKLAGMFTNKKYPGVGISIGLTRLFHALMKSGIIDTPPPTVAPILIVNLQPSHISTYLKIASELRENNINTEVYLEEKKLSTQMKYANAKGFIFVILAGDEELKKNKLIIKNMKDGKQVEIPSSDLISYLKEFM